MGECHFSWTHVHSYMYIDLCNMQAKPLLQMGTGMVQELLDPRQKCKTLLCSEQVLRMIQAADACINSEELSRPTIDKIVAILRGEEQTCLFRPRSCTFSGNGCVVDCCNTQSQETKSEIKSHLALAMLGVAEESEDYEHFSCRWPFFVSILNITFCNYADVACT